jgi:threonine dehydrogenase-like Zn-dependent dehydrogenase
MKALVLNALGRGFDFEDVDIAAPIGREVLVDVQAYGLCHTDLLFAIHDFVPTPSVLGHEVAGVVAAVGPDVAQIRVEDHIVGSLAPAVLGTDLARARHVASQIRAGRVVINSMTDDPQAPWGGFKYSGFGREYGRYGIEAFLETWAIFE